MLLRRERTGVIVVRVWLEAGADDGLRARITAVRDLESEEVDNAAASSVEEIVDVVQRFVESFAAN
jgi:hypothetical protein